MTVLLKDGTMFNLRGVSRSEFRCGECGGGVCRVFPTDSLVIFVDKTLEYKRSFPKISFICEPCGICYTLSEYDGDCVKIKATPENHM